jgi:hypothetical protein
VPFCTRRHSKKPPGTESERIAGGNRRPCAWNILDFSHNFSWGFTEARIGIITDGNALVR